MGDFTAPGCLAGSLHWRGWRRRLTCRSGGHATGAATRRLDGERARDAHLEPALLDLDLAQAGLVEELGKLADQLLLAAEVLALILGRHRFAFPSCAALSCPPGALSHDARPPAFGHGLERQLVTLGAEAADHAFGPNEM